MVPPLGGAKRFTPDSFVCRDATLQNRIALYENGSFIANWSMPVFERFLKAPQQFELITVSDDRSPL